jgi:GNAT superfamily N-acetyltransferase
MASSKPSPTLDEMLDMAERERQLEAEANRLLYEDDEREEASTVDVQLQSEHSASDALLEEPTDVDMNEDDEAELVRDELQAAMPAAFVRPDFSARGFGPVFLDVLDKLLTTLEPFAAMKDVNAREKIFSHAAKVKMTGETKKVSAHLWNELHEAIFLDRKIRFTPPKPKPLVFNFEKGFNCTCEMVHAAVTNCPHQCEAHLDLCKAAVEKEEKKIYAKTMISRGIQTDKLISPTHSRSSSVASKERVPASNRGFARGGTRGKSSKPHGQARGRDTERNRSPYTREKKDDRERSRSAFERDRPRSQDRPRTQSTSTSTDRSRYHFKRPSQPAQDRLKEERKRMEDPVNRKKAEEAAAKAKKEADKISAQLKQAEASSSRKTSDSKPARHGDYALDNEGNIDYARCPVVTPPPGMHSTVTVKNGYWDVSFSSHKP